jgi:hypothetical protein
MASTSSSSSSKLKVLTAEEFFGTLDLDSRDILWRQGQRKTCPKCKASRKYYCYDCFEVLLDEPAGASAIPVVRLPKRVSIIKHRGEIDGKSTAVHARILAPRDVSIYNYPDLPHQADLSRAVLLFPSKESQPIESIDPSSFDHVVFVDSTWFQANSILQVISLLFLSSLDLSKCHFPSIESYFFHAIRRIHA